MRISVTHQSDFGGRSLDMSMHPDYAEDLQKLTTVMTDPERRKNYSSAEKIAQVVFEAATDGKSTLRYVAGDDAKAMYAQRKEVGDEAFRAGVRNMFLG